MIDSTGYDINSTDKTIQQICLYLEVKPTLDFFEYSFILHLNLNINLCECLSMAILFVTQSILFSVITLAIVVGWILFSFRARPNSGHSLFEADNIKFYAIAFVLMLFG